MSKKSYADVAMFAMFNLRENHFDNNVAPLDEDTRVDNHLSLVIKGLGRSKAERTITIMVFFLASS